MGGFPTNQPRQLEPIKVIDGDDEVGQGRPPYVPLEGERKAVWIAAACGVPQEEIAKHLNDGNGISKHTLQKYFRKELNEGMWEANMMAAGTLLDTIKGCKDLKIKQRATEFWLERRMGFTNANQQQNEPGRLLITVEGGLPKIT